MKRCLVYGANGALGRQMVQAFKSNSWVFYGNKNVTGIDFVANQEAHQSITLSKTSTTLQVQSTIETEIKEILKDAKLDCIVNVAGGWVGGNLQDEKLLENVEVMMNQSVSSSIISARIAALHLKLGGLVVLTGAGAATHGTPGFIM
jgi:dihydropteridine reductase